MEFFAKKGAEKFSAKQQRTMTTSNGNLVSYDFIPGSLEQEPILMLGGLWYQIKNFETFFNNESVQSEVREGLIKDIDLMLNQMHEYVTQGHPVIIPARATQPESILASLKSGKIPNFVDGFFPELKKQVKTTVSNGSIEKSPSTRIHAQDAVDILHDLQKRNLVGNKKVHLMTLSFGSSEAVEAKKILLEQDQVLHTHIIAPLVTAGDNYPRETQMKNQALAMMNAPFSFAKSMNPFMSPFADLMTSMNTNVTEYMTASSYATKLVDNAFANTPELAALEKEFPGYKEMVSQGLRNDMNAARPDRFNLADPENFKYFKNTTIYFAGDEEPARLKAQLKAYMEIRKALGSEAPDLVFMDDAMHAITASATAQTSAIFTVKILDDNKQDSSGRIFYMHRMDKNLNIHLLSDKEFAILVDEVNRESIGPENLSVLEVLKQPDVFVSRINFIKNSIEDLQTASKGKQPLPPNYVADKTRPYQELFYKDLTPDDYEKINQAIIKYKAQLEEYLLVDAKAGIIIKANQVSEKASK